MLIKKRTIKIIVGVIVAIALIVGIIFAFKAISTNIKIKDTESKLSKINAEELQTKLIKELENTPLNKNDYTYNTEFLENTDGVVVAKIVFNDKSSNETESVTIPCFQIDSYSNGNFKSITYWEMDELLKSVNNKIEETFKNDYDINIIIKDDSMYNSHFRTTGNNQKVEMTDKIVWDMVYYDIAGEEDYGRTYLYLPIKFGLDK